MLAANETVAEHFHWLKVPFIYRIHEDPDQEKPQNFMAFAANFGHQVKGRGNSIHPRAAAKPAGSHSRHEGANGAQHHDAPFDEAGEI